MFNIKKKIYVAHADEYIDLMYERSLVLHKKFPSLDSFDRTNEDTSLKGAIGAFSNLNELLILKFEGDIKKFHEFLNVEEDLLIIADADDYGTLYAHMLLELQNDFGVSDENIKKMIDNQRLKDFFQGSETMRKFMYAQNANDSSLERVINKVKASYQPTGQMFRAISQLPFEVIYAMYKWGNITKTQANGKISEIAGPLLIGQIHNIIEQAKVAVGSDLTIMADYMEQDIRSVDDVIKVIFNYPLLTKLFCTKEDGVVDVDLSNANDLADIKRLCSIIIDKDMDFDSQPEVDQQELDFFFELYEKQDIDVIDSAKFNFISTGMIATKQEKFNTGLIMAE